MESEIQALVIGGGPSGLAVAYGLQGDTLVLEREATVGGLCRSVHHGGGTFDIGGHSFHTPHPEVSELVQHLLDGGLHTQRREARVYTHGKLIPYPFQKFFTHISNPQVIRECEAGLRNARGNTADARNLQEYITREFGQGIAEHFMLPYNRKLWGRDVRQVSCEWTVERVAAARGENEQFQTSGGQRRPLQPDTQVGYPRVGGYQEIPRGFVPHLPGLELQSSVVHIEPRARLATTNSGQQYRWRVLISTIPLPVLLQIIEGTPEEIKALAAQLEHISLRVELLLVGRQLNTSIQRIYVADPDIPPHKIALNHNSSPYLCGQPRHGITAEVSLSPANMVDVTEIAPKTAALLCELGILDSPGDIVWEGHVEAEYAYPVYTPRRPDLVKGIKAWLAQHHIYTLGRFGDWEYINSDKCIAKGLALARTLRQRHLGD